ncbi:MAG: hypothetical protein FMNOHCHN_02001 [Ignavibacteriaceae bacterium]|nr:hypothetical protein [Ignavibacteriaceae bacterium]
MLLNSFSFRQITIYLQARGIILADGARIFTDLFRIMQQNKSRQSLVSMQSIVSPQSLVSLLSLLSLLYLKHPGFKKTLAPGNCTLFIVNCTLITGSFFLPRCTTPRTFADTVYMIDTPFC